MLVNLLQAYFLIIITLQEYLVIIMLLRPARVLSAAMDHDDRYGTGHRHGLLA